MGFMIVRLIVGRLVSIVCMYEILKYFALQFSRSDLKMRLHNIYLSPGIYSYIRCDCLFTTQ